jgi:predicted nucleic acid-binding protein
LEEIGARHRFSRLLHSPVLVEEIGARYRFSQFWDAMILSAAADAGCTLLLSEDMQNGFVARGVTVVNPLADAPHPRLAGLLGKR